MTLTMDPAERQAREFTCQCCNAAVQRVWSWVRRDGAVEAVYFANCYHHADQPHDAWLDVILGTWDAGSGVRRRLEQPDSRHRVVA